jgi:hypothetical protein
MAKAAAAKAAAAIMAKAWRQHRVMAVANIGMAWLSGENRQ